MVKKEQPSIDPVDNSVVAALGNIHGQEINIRRGKFQYYPFLVIENALYLDNLEGVHIKKTHPVV